MQEIGAALVEHAKGEAEFSAQRGLVDELFPYIYAASDRMSSRSISRWLAETRNIKLSRETIARALRNPQKYWEAMFERVERAAELFANYRERSIRSVLTEEGVFALSKDDALPGRFRNAEEAQQVTEAYEDAVSTLEEHWFAHDEGVREACLANVGRMEDEIPEDPDGKDGDKNESGQQHGTA